MTGWQPDADHRQWQAQARVIETKHPGWAVLFGAHSRLFWAFGAPDGRPIAARSASELLGRMRAADRSRLTPPYRDGRSVRR
jgi:hypothetical protein